MFTGEGEKLQGGACMKSQFGLRCVIMVLVLSLLGGSVLSGCKTSLPDTGTTQTPVMTSFVETTAETTEGTQPTTEPQMVTIYLVEQSTLYDSGSTQYFYGENYNIERMDAFYVEHDMASSTTFGSRDANGMPGQAKVDWDDDYTETYAYVWSQSGKLLEEKDVAGFSALQFSYDEQGNLLQIEEYYEDEKFATFHYEYSDGVLQGSYCVNTDGHMNYECLTQNGFITEKRCYDEKGYLMYTYYYTYDENRNLAEVSLVYDGEQVSGTTYTYRAVEVSSDRAAYLLEQQKYLLHTDLEYTLPPLDGTPPEPPVIDNTVTLEQLCLQMAEDGKLFAVAYLGYMTYDYETVYDYIDYICEEVTWDLPFLAQIPETNIITKDSQGEVYCVIPADPETNLEVYTGTSETALNELIYEGTGEEPYLLVCNSDFSPDTEILMEDSEGICTVWHPMLDDYLFVDQPRYASGGTGSLDFSPYNDLLLSYYYSLMEEDGWEIPAEESLHGTTWFWDGYNLAENYYFYSVTFDENTVDVRWNPGYGDDCEYIGAAWNYDHGVLTIDFDQFAGVHKYNVLVNCEEGTMYIASDATAEKLYWDSEPLYRFLIKEEPTEPSTESVMSLVGNWERTQTEVDGYVEETPAGQVTVQITGSSTDDLWIEYTDNEYSDRSYGRKALTIVTDGDTMGFGSVQWIAEVDFTDTDGQSVTLALVDGALIIRNYFAVDGMQMVSYETFRPVS